MSAEVAWEAMVKADKQRDDIDFEEAFFCYAKSQHLAGEPIDLVDMEKGFREQGYNTYFIAKVILDH
jgi:hypothetical protein